MKTINISRLDAKQWNAPLENAAWISIGEPDDDKTIAANKFLDAIPKLKLQFYDLEFPVSQIGGGVISPPTLKDAHRIMRFILNNKGKDFIVNCAMGVARSGAICKFLETHLNYFWPEENKKLARPNKLLYNLLDEAYSIRFSDYGPNN